jgi:hypothetical protein
MAYWTDAVAILIVGSAAADGGNFTAGDCFEKRHEGHRHHSNRGHGDGGRACR